MKDLGSLRMRSPTYLIAVATLLLIVNPAFSAPVNTTPPSISGDPQPNSTLTGTPGVWTNTDNLMISRQWFADGVAISGATNLSYTIPASQTCARYTLTETAQTAGITLRVSSNVKSHFDPSCVSNTELRIWHDAKNSRSIAHSGNRVSSWTNLANPTTPLTTSAGTPMLETDYAVRFTGDLMAAPDSFDGTVQDSIQFIVQTENVPSANVMYSLNGNHFRQGLGRFTLAAPIASGVAYFDYGYCCLSRDRIAASYPPGNNLTHITAIHSHTNQHQALYFNGLLAGSRSNQQRSPSDKGLLIGHEAVDHSLHEYIAYKGSINRSTQQQIEGYLAEKWGFRHLLPTQHLYTSAEVSTLGIHSQTLTTAIPSGQSGVWSISLTAPPNDPVILDLSSSNAAMLLSSRNLTFDASNWDQPQTVTLNNTAIGGSSNTTLTASVNNTLSDKDYVDVNDLIERVASVGNSPPLLVNAMADQRAVEGEAFSLVIPDNTFHDADYWDSLSYLTTTLPYWLAFDPLTRTVSGTPGNDEVGDHMVTLVAFDSLSTYASDSFLVTVTNSNSPPTLATPLTKQHAIAGTVFNVIVPSTTFSDADTEDTLRYSASTLPEWLSFDAETRTLSGSPSSDDVGNHTVTITAIDRSSASAEATFLVSVAGIGSRTVTEHTIPDLSTVEDQPFNFTLPTQSFSSVSTDNAQRLSATTLPTWLSFNANTRTLSGTPANEHVGEHSVSILSIIYNGASISEQFTITVSNVNDPPSINRAMVNQNALENSLFRLPINDSVFVDIDQDDTLNFAMIEAPSWLEIDNNTLYGTPTQSDLGSSTVTIQATDSGGASATSSFDIHVHDVNDTPPSITSPEQINVLENTTDVIYLATANDPDTNDTISWQLQTGADNELFRIDPNSGALRFNNTPDAEAPLDTDADNRYQLLINARDGAGNTSTLALSVDVLGINEAPTASTHILSIDEFAHVGTTVAQLSATDPEHDTLHWALLSRDVPFTLTEQGTLTLSAPLDFETRATYTLQAHLSDTALTTPLSLTVQVIDGSDIGQLMQLNTPITAQALIAQGIIGARIGREQFYTSAIAAADIPNASLSDLQAIIDQANATADVVTIGDSLPSVDTTDPTDLAAANTLDTASVEQALNNAQIQTTHSSNLNAYVYALANAEQVPTTQQTLQTLVDSVNRVVDISQLSHQLNSTSDADRSDSADAIATQLSQIEAMPTIDNTLIGELSAAIARAQPPAVTEPELIELVNSQLERVNTHPVVHLIAEQNGAQILNISPSAGLVTLTVHLQNPIDGLTPSFDWSESDAKLLAMATLTNTNTQTFTLDPTRLSHGETLYARATVSRHGQRSDASLALPVSHETLQDDDGDGILNMHEGSLEASVNLSAANQLQTSVGDDTYYLIESPVGTLMRLGSIARAARANQSHITLDDMINHGPHNERDNVIDALLAQGTLGQNPIVDFEVSSLPHAGASIEIVLALKEALLPEARYMKYHPATGWQDYSEDSLNHLASAPTLNNTMGLCPAPEDTTWRKGLNEGDACLRLRIEDGGPNDADRLLSSGAPAPDNGINGTIIDPGTLLYPAGADTSTQPTTAVQPPTGSGALASGLLILLLVLTQRTWTLGHKTEPLATAKQHSV